MSGPSVPIRLDVVPRPGVCPGCGVPVAWFETTARRWECFDGTAAVVPEFEHVTRPGGPELRPTIGYVAEALLHKCRKEPPRQ